MRYWLPVCRHLHVWIHRHNKQAIALGLLANGKDLNTPDRTDIPRNFEKWLDELKRIAEKYGHKINSEDWGCYFKE